MFHGSFGTGLLRRRRDGTRRRLAVELLERRELLAIDAAFQDGVLNIVSDAHDDIVVTGDRDFVKINGADPAFGALAAAEVAELHVNGGKLSYIDLSAARGDRETFSALSVTVESGPPQSSRIDEALAAIYADPSIRPNDLSVLEKLARAKAFLSQGSQPVGHFDWFGTAIGPDDYVQANSPLTSLDGDEGGTITIYTPDPVLESSGWMMFSVGHNGDEFNGLTVDYATSDGTATAPDDYGNTNGTLTWLDGDEGEVRTIWVPIVNDNIDEPDEDFHVTLSNLQNFDGDEGDASLGNSQATGTIIDDDPTPTITIDDVDVDEWDGTATFTVTVVDISAETITVDWTTADGTAVSPEDYAAASGTLNLGSGDTTDQITINIVDDDVFEPIQGFSILLSNAQNALIIDGTGSGAIHDMGVDVDTDSNNDGIINSSDDPASDPSFEESDPGNILRYNDDDDNGNMQPDRDDPAPFEFPNGDPAFDDDLEKAIVSYMQNPGDNRDGYVVEIDDSGISPELKLWQTQDKQPLQMSYVIGTDTLPTSLYAEGYEEGVADLEVVLKTPGGQEIRRDKVRFTVLRVNLEIGHGQNNGSTFLSEEDEFDVGAVTVANLNDTDGDGRSDSLDNDVRSADTSINGGIVNPGQSVLDVASVDGFSVGDSVVVYTPGVQGPNDRRTIQSIDTFNSRITLSSGLTYSHLFPRLSHGGRTEVDLMPLRINPPIYADLENNPTMTLTVSGNARLWENEWKENEILLDASGQVEFGILTYIGLGKTIWVEATSASPTLQDITLSLSYLGVSDTVRATGMWSSVTAVKHDTSSLVDVLTAFPSLTENEHEDPLLLIAQMGGTGLRPISPAPVGVGNLIVLQFTVSPAGIQSLEDSFGNKVVEFDVTRQVEHAFWLRPNATQQWQKASAGFFPWEVERANDDFADTDESSRPDDANGHFYVVDAPGLITDSAIINGGLMDDAVFRLAAQEWMRVSFNGTEPSGNTISGSRASSIQTWHVVHTLEEDTLKWKRTTGDSPEVPGVNVVDTGLIYVGAQNDEP